MDTIQEKIEKIILKENELLKILLEYESLFNTFGQFEHHFISTKIINKLVDIQSKIISQQENLLLTFSSLRYIFETLIHTKLLIKEPKHIYKLFFSVYEHQVGKTSRLIERLEREITLIEKYVKLETDGLNKIKGLSQKGEKEIKDLLDKIKADENEFDEQAERELTIFFGDYKFNGFPYQKHLMENELLPKYKARLAELEKLKAEKTKQILKDNRISSLFNFSNQTSKVFKELEDNRKWVDKAKEVNLEKEYNQMYELSSAILHSNSYSLITPLETEESEKQFVTDLILKYSYEILENIESFLDLKRIMKIKVVNLK